ncbi:MAG: hypothetical protein K6F66_00280 [Pseudobutyrivibrio sp.]|nr:hypothetical protein [Pseudobutyrivibrio sp.]
MDKTDILFKTHLNYQIEAQTDVEDTLTISVEEVENIDLHHCTFSDFKKALTFARDNYPDYDFSDSTLEAVKPADHSDTDYYDFIELSEYAKHNAISFGNMALFNELKRISSAAELFNVNHSSNDNLSGSDDLLLTSYIDMESVPTIYEDLGSCVIGGGDLESYRLTATFHDSSRKERPIIAIRCYNVRTNSYNSNPDIIDITAIYKPEATLMEAFAYMCYQDFKKKRDSVSFDRLLTGGGIEVTTLDDMYSLHYDLRIYDKIYGHR